MLEPTQRPSTEVAREIICSIDPVGIHLLPRTEDIARIRDAIDRHFACKTANDYKHVLRACYEVLERLPLDPHTGKAYTISYVSHIPEDISDEGRKVLQTIRSFYDGMLRVLNKGDKGNSRKSATADGVRSPEEIAAVEDDLQKIVFHNRHRLRENLSFNPRCMTMKNLLAVKKLEEAIPVEYRVESDLELGIFLGKLSMIHWLRGIGAESHERYTCDRK